MSTDKIAACRRAERAAMARIIFWSLNVPLACVVYALDRPLWERASILYLALVSIIALIEGPYSSRAAKRAERGNLEENEDA